MPVPAVPEWLTKRDGGFTPGIREYILFVTVGKHPHYRLETRRRRGSSPATCRRRRTAS